MTKKNPGGIEFDAPGGVTRIPASGFAGLRTELRQDTYRRFSWMAGLVATIAAVRLITTLFIEGPSGLILAPFGALGIVLVISLGVSWTCRTAVLPAEWFPTFAIAFEVLVAIGFGTIILNWQNLLGASGWPLGAIPGVGVWVILFANIVPLSPPQHLVGALLAGLTIPVWFFASLSLYDVPADIGPEQNLRVFQQLMVPMGNNSSKKEFTSWDDLVTAMSVGGMRLRCRLDNATADTTRDCLEITEEGLPER